MSQSIKKTNFSTCKWPTRWCQWKNWFPSYFNPSEKERALTRQLICLSVRFFIVPSALITINYAQPIFISVNFSHPLFRCIFKENRRCYLLSFVRRSFTLGVAALNRILWSRLEFNGLRILIPHFENRFLFRLSAKIWQLYVNWSSIPLLHFFFFFSFVIFANFIYCLF